MELAFSTKKLREVCEIESRAIKALGQETALILRRRISDLRAADSVSELISGGPRELVYLSQVAYSLNLKNSQRIIICPNHTLPAKLDIDTVDWKTISRVKVIEIEGVS